MRIQKAMGSSHKVRAQHSNSRRQAAKISKPEPATRWENVKMLPVLPIQISNWQMAMINAARVEKVQKDEKRRGDTSPGLRGNTEMAILEIKIPPFSFFA